MGFAALVGTWGMGDWPGGTQSPADDDAGGRIGMVPLHVYLLPAGTGGQRDEERPSKSLHVWSLPWRYHLPADAETTEESLLGFPSELSVLERLGLHR